MTCKPLSLMVKMENTILYASDLKSARLKVANGKKMPLKERSSLPFTIENLEMVLQEQYGEISISENEWSRKQDAPAYIISIDIHAQQTLDQIKDYLFTRFTPQPLGGHRNYRTLTQVDLYLYYKIASETFYLQFLNVNSAPAPR